MVVGGIESEQQDSAATIDLDQGLGGQGHAGDPNDR